MAIKIEELVVELVAKNDDYIRELKESRDAAQKASKGMRAAMDSAAASTKRSSSIMVRALGTAAGFIIRDVVNAGFRLLSSAVKQAGRDFLDFSAATAEVNSILPKNQKLTEAMKDTFIEFSNNFSGTAAGQAKSFYNIVSAGITDSAQATNLLRVANLAAVAGITTTNIAVNALTNSLAVFGRSGLTAEKASDILFATVREGKTTFQELSSNLGKVTSIANAAGATFDEVAGSLAFLTKSGLSTDEAATGLTALFTGIVKPADDAAKAAKELGIEFNVAALRSKGLAGFMESVRLATGGNVETIARLFPNIRALNTAIQLTGGSFEDFERILDTTKNAMGDTATAFKEVEKSADFQFERLTQSLRNIGLIAFQALEEDIAGGLKSARAAIPGLIDGIASLIQAVEVMREVFTEFNEGIQILVDGADLAFAKMGNAIGLVSDNELAEFNKDLADTVQRFNDVEGKESSFDKISNALTAAAERMREVESATSDTKIAFEQMGDLAEQVAEQAKERSEEAAAARETEINDLISRNELLAELDQIANDEEIQRNEARITALGAQEEGLTNLKIKLMLRERKKRDQLDTMRLTATASMLGSLASLSQSSGKKGFALAKALSLAQATITGIQSVQAAATAPPFPPLNSPLVAAAALAAAARVAQIASTSLQKGIDTVPGGLNEPFSATLHGGERVVPSQTNTDLKEFLARANANGGAQRIVIEVRTTGDFAEVIETALIEGERFVTSERAS